MTRRIAGLRSINRCVLPLFSRTMAVARKVFDEIKEIREDILDVYSFAGPRSPPIEIYWMAQALFAAAFGLRIEDLTVVTLTS